MRHGRRPDRPADTDPGAAAPPGTDHVGAVRDEAARLTTRLAEARRALERVTDHRRSGDLGTACTARGATDPDEPRAVRKVSAAGSRLDDPGTLEALSGLVDPCARRLSVLSTVVDGLATGRLDEAAALEGLRHLASTQPVRGPR